MALEDVLAATTEDREKPPAVAITFDDGYEDNFTEAYPALAQAGMTATFFVTAGLVQRDPAVLRRMSGLYGVGEGVIRPMDWDQVRQLAAEGFSVGSHTYGHPNLARLEPSEARADMHRARDLLEDRLGAPVPLFAYPFGRPRFHLTADTVEAVRSAGHTTAAAVLFRGVKPTDDRLLIPRFFVEGHDVATLEEKVVGRWDPMGLWQEHVQRGVLPLRLDSTNRPYE